MAKRNDEIYIYFAETKWQERLISLKFRQESQTKRHAAYIRHEHAAWTFQVQTVCPFPSCMSMSMLQVHVHAASPCLCCMSKSMLHVCVQAVCPCPCCMFMSMLLVHVHAAFPCTCCLSMSSKFKSMQLLHVNAACSSPCYMSKYVLHGLEHAAFT